MIKEEPARKPGRHFYIFLGGVVSVCRRCLKNGVNVAYPFQAVKHFLHKVC